VQSPPRGVRSSMQNSLAMRKVSMPRCGRLCYNRLVSPIKGRGGQRPTGTQAVMNSFGRHLDQPCHGGFPPSKLQRTTVYILAHLESPLSLTELAVVAQMSPSHFAHLFKQAIGQTPHQYVIRCRMERAKHLLTGTTLPIHEIGARVGCADHSHFTALFRRYVASTPKAYRDTTSGA